MPTPESERWAREWLNRNLVVPWWVERYLPSLAALLDEVQEEAEAQFRHYADQEFEGIRPDSYIREAYEPYACGLIHEIWKRDPDVTAERQRCVQAVRKHLEDDPNNAGTWSPCCRKNARAMRDEILRELGLDDQGKAPEPQAETRHMWCPYCGRVYDTISAGVYTCGPHMNGPGEFREGFERMRELSPDEQPTASNPSARSALLMGCLVNGGLFYI